jgi:hypothetical protein
LLRAVTGSTDDEGMREKVRQKVEESLRTSNGFELRVFSLNDALHVYFENGFDVANFSKLRSLKADIANLVADTERRKHMSNKDWRDPERKELDERIMEACTMKASEKEGGLLLWLGEGDMQWLADDFDVNIRCWNTEWVLNKAGDCVVDHVKLVYTVTSQQIQSWGTIAPRPSEAMLLSLAEKGVRWTRAKGSCCEYMVHNRSFLHILPPRSPRAAPQSPPHPGLAP